MQNVAEELSEVAAFDGTNMFPFAVIPVSPTTVTSSAALVEILTIEKVTESPTINVGPPDEKTVPVGIVYVAGAAPPGLAEIIPPAIACGEIVAVVVIAVTCDL